MNLSGKVEVNGEEYLFPNSWDEVTIDLFINIQKMLKNNSLSEKEKELMLVSLMTGIDSKLLEKSSVLVVKYILSHFGFLRYTSNFLKNEVSESFEFNGEKFILPNNIGNITYSQYTNIDYFVNKALEDEIEVYEFSPQIISLLSVKDGEEYKFEKSKERFELFKNLPVKLAYGIINFFLSRGENFKRLTLLFLMAQENLLTQMSSLKKSIKSGRGSAYVGNLALHGISQLRKSVENL